MPITINPKGLTELSADTSLLVDRLRQVAVGDVVTYDELSAVIGRDVRGSRKSPIGCFYSARRIATRDYKLVFSTIKNVGLKRLDDLEIISTGDDSLSRIHRESKRGLKRLECVDDYSKLNNDDRINLSTRLAGLSALHEVTKRSAVVRLQSVVATSTQTLPLLDTLCAFVK